MQGQSVVDDTPTTIPPKPGEQATRRRSAARHPDPTRRFRTITLSLALAILMMTWPLAALAGPGNDNGTGKAGSANQSPTATFTYSCVDLSCTFDASGSDDPDGPNKKLSYVWDFGDDAGGNGVHVSHGYAADGTYHVTLTVTDHRDDTGTDAKDVTVTSPPPPNTPPTASFTYTCTDLSCDFDGSASSDAEDGTPTSYAWDFGDGATDTGVSPSNTYGSGGTYNVTLTVTDSGGLQDTTSQDVTVSDPPTSKQAAGMTAGFDHSCAWLTDGTATCWGRNDNGQLGDGTTTSRPTPGAVEGLADVAGMAAGVFHTCAWLANGTATCWGHNDHGQLGDGTTADRSTPVAVLDLTDVAGMTAGSRHTCAWLTDGTAKCWGMNTYGQVGDGTTTDRLTPATVRTSSIGILDVQVGLGVEFRSVAGMAAGGFHTCAWLADSTAACWGNNWFGQVGDGTETDRSTPRAVLGLADVTGMTAAGFFTCAWLGDGSAKCWGSNSGGQLGDGTRTSRSAPLDVQGLSDVAGLTAGGSHACAWIADGTAKCWGWNADGQLGDGTTFDGSTPVAVLGVTSVAGMTAGSGHSCAWIADGSAQCWGRNDFGQLGDGEASSPATTPRPVVGCGPV